MNISTTKEKFVRAITLAERLTGKKESLPVLSCILIDATQDIVIVRATNLEAGIEITIPATVTEKGMVAVPAQILSQTIRALTTDTVSLVVEDGNLLIASKGSKTLIKAIPHTEFPHLTSPENENKPLEVKKRDILDGIESVMYAASQSMIRPELGSILLSFKEDGFTSVATDSFRLAEKHLSHAGQDVSCSILLPLKHTHELSTVLQKIDTETVYVSVDDVQLDLVGDGVRYTSRVVEGTFPNYKDIIPKSSKTEVVILKNDFNELLRKARVFAGEDQHIGFHIYPQKKLFSATAQSNAIGEMSDTLDASLTGEDLDINFHIGYISECLGSIPTDSIVLAFSGIGRPLVIRGVSENTFTYLVMPLNR